MLLADWQILKRLNGLPGAGSNGEHPPVDDSTPQTVAARGIAAVNAEIPHLDLGFRHSSTEVVALLWPE